VYWNSKIAIKFEKKPSAKQKTRPKNEQLSSKTSPKLATRKSPKTLNSIFDRPLRGWSIYTSIYQPQTKHIYWIYSKILSLSIASPIRSSSHFNSFGCSVRHPYCNIRREIHHPMQNPPVSLLRLIYITRHASFSRTCGGNYENYSRNQLIVPKTSSEMLLWLWASRYNHSTFRNRILN